MVKSPEINASEIEEIVTKFPGPIILTASRLKWWVMIVLSGGMTALGIYLAIFIYIHPSRVKGDVHDAHLAVGILILCTIFFGLATVASVIQLRSGSLRLDEDGFEFTTGLFRKQIFRWSEVRDFTIFRQRASSFVVFKATKPRWGNSLGKLNALLAGGRNEGLPDTYGFGARELVQLMTAWQNSATKAVKST